MRSVQYVRSLAAGLAVAGLVAGTGVGAQEPLTEETYGATMAEVRLLVGDAERYIDSRYWPELGETLDKLFPMFRQIEAFWEGRGTDSALATARESIAALQEIGQAGIDMNVGTAQAGVQTLRATCASCHEAHREPDGDGFRIKAGS